MHTRVLQCHAGTLLVRPLRRGDVRTVLAVFERLGEESRRRRFNGAKPCLRPHELRRLAAVDARHHALVAYLENDPRPVAIARVVRTGRSAEIAFEVADEHQQRGIGAALTAELVADARAAGVTELTALVASDNRPALALLGRTLGKLTTRLEGADRWVSASIATGAAGGRT
jgi:ribosomal protein S18 acetylase RimI-like enzyme